jgi:hypothetical protein
VTIDREAWLSGVHATSGSFIVGDNCDSREGARRGKEDQMTGGVWEMAKVLVIEGALQVGEYTITSRNVSEISQSGIDSAGVFMVKAKWRQRSLGRIARSQHNPGSAVETCSGDRRHCARSVNDPYGKDRINCVRVWGPAGVVRNGRRGPSSGMGSDSTSREAKLEAISVPFGVQPDLPSYIGLGEVAMQEKKEAARTAGETGAQMEADKAGRDADVV